MGSINKSATECLMTDIEAYLTYYKYPYQHWKRIRTTNVVKRSFKEVKGRTKGIRFNDEQMSWRWLTGSLKNSSGME